ncbi:MAG: ammonium transporter [Kiritimatiellales bacterium]|nr:ammonium transporter [Kiritimatiellales bacterium]
MFRITKRTLGLMLALCAIAMPLASMAEEAAPAVVAAVEAAAPAVSAADAMFAVNNTWMMVSIFLVFTMHLGFATVEAGLTRAKNTVNILFKNTAIVAIGLLTYTLIGFNLMYPGDSWLLGKVLGFAGFGVGNGLAFNDPALITSAYNPGYTYWTDFLFQGMFAATAATIVSGAVAERIKLGPFLIFCTLYVALVYPFVGSWVWGAGWLSTLGGCGFHDFAGSTLVHSVGGWGALAGIIMLGPRLGKYVNGKVKAIMGHSMPLLTIGVFLLWLGWFGFNGGSVLSADPGMVSYVLVTTSLAAAAGIIGSMVATWTIQNKPDLSMVLNGCLAGLVGITAGADVVSVKAAVLIGLICGAVAVVSVMAFDKIKIDDPVGATTVHLVCGILGTLFAGVFSADYKVWVQLVGIAAYGAVCFPAALAIFGVLKATVGLRVSKEEELKGLDLGEHGMEAYNGFQFFTNM